jgi:UDPglucose 6-dehydrogenase
MKRLAVVGTGYVGLVSGAMFASVGNNVTCVDKDPSIVEALRSGRCTIHEPGLEEILHASISDGTLHFTSDLRQAVESAEATLIAVGTPSGASGAYDFQYVEAAAREIGRVLQGNKPHFVVIKSTVTPDVYARVNAILSEETARSGAAFEVISNPEFLAEGTAVRDFGQPHRIIVGAVSDEARDFMESLYAPFVRRTPGLLQFASPESAIVTKLAANSFLACRVALINELARYCDAAGADIEQVRIGLATDPRIGHLFLYPGPGYGGSCFGKDIRALRESAREHGTPLRVVPAIEESNNEQQLYTPRRVEQYLGGVHGKTIAIWGIAFKARTDDIRESPAVTAIEYFLERGASIQAHDPHAAERAAERFGSKIKICENRYDAVEGAAALVIMTEWDAYKSPDYEKLRNTLTARAVFDSRNILDAEQAREVGLIYVGTGRSGQSPTIETAQMG